jgi:S1-C subfamily serine protease
MKSLFDKKSRNRNLLDKNRVNRLFNSTSQVTRLIFYLFGAGMFLSGYAVKLKLTTFASITPQNLSQEIEDIASEISVKVSGRDFLGSGFIVKQEANKYIVITNQHVLRAGEAPYFIETNDGRVYPAQIIANTKTSDRQYDLAILEFESDTVYSTATIGNSVYLEVGEPVFAAGFPYNELDISSQSTPAIFEQPEANSSSSLVLKRGRVAIVLTQALEEGYQIGYTNDVRKGMSGGPLLNSQGQVVGVNGKHAYPLWESPEIYQDGSQPCPALQELITRSSLAIPIEKSIELTPQLKFFKSSDSELRQPNLLLENPQLVEKMQLEAQQTIQSCQNYFPKINSNDNSVNY